MKLESKINSNSSFLITKKSRLAELREGAGRVQVTRMEEEPRELPQEVVQSIIARQKELNAMRKERKKNTEIAGRFAAAQVGTTASLTLNNYF